MIDVEKLLTPIAEADPTGPDLEYDPAFTELERRSQGRPEQQMGKAVVAGEPPDYGWIVDHAVELLGRTKDLRVAAHLVPALLQRGGIPAFALGLKLIQGLLERYWPNVHPRLDPEDGNDPTIRVSALLSLGTVHFVSAVRAVPFLRARAAGVVSLRDIHVASGELPPGDGPPADPARVEGVFQEVDFETLDAALTGLKDGQAALAGLEKAFEVGAGSRGADLTALSQLLRLALHTVEPRVEARRPVPVVAEAAQGGGAAAPKEPQALTGEIRSRDDVLKALEKICGYYARNEPSSPLPLLLDRCKRLVPLGFAEILKDLAPGGLPQLEQVAGKKAD